MTFRAPGHLLSALTAGAVLLTAGVAVTSSAAGAAAANSCANPVLATDAAGWGTLNGEPFSRTAVTDHPVAQWEFSVANRTATAAGIYLPQIGVQPGQTWTFSVDTRTRNDPARARIEVDWYSTTNRFLGHDDGDYRAVDGQRTHTHTTGTFTAPPTAVLAHVLVRATDLAANSGFATTMCEYQPTGTEPQPTPTTPGPTAPPGTDGTTAAGTFGWGRPTSGDEFNDPRTPLSDTWNRQEGESDGCYPGHDDKGLRCTANITENNGMLTVVGQPDGTTGLMQSKHTSYRGRWETRMRVDPTGVRDSEYHPVLLLWPAAEDFPVGGEIDYSESESSSSHVSFFLHYGANNSQVGDVPGNGRQNLNLTEWHNYAVEWNRTCVRGFIDGVRWFEDCTSSHQPPRAMKQAIQLDYFPAGSGSRIDGDVRMNVDWTRFYPAP